MNPKKEVKDYCPSSYQIVSKIIEEEGNEVYIFHCFCLFDDIL